MQEKERHHDDEPQAGAIPARGSGRGAAALERAARLGDRGQAVLDRALSGDSERYLAAIRQHGGE